MGPHAKTMILLLLLFYLDPFLGRVKGFEYGETSAKSATNEGMIEVKIRKLLKLEVDTIRDYTPIIPNPKHDPPPRGKSATSAGGGGVGGGGGGT